MSTEDEPPPPPPEDVPPQELYPAPEAAPQAPLDPIGPPPFVDPNIGPPPFVDPNVGPYVEPPLVPHDASLTEAVGAPSPSALRRKARDERTLGDDGEPLQHKRSRRTMTIAAASLFGGLAIAALIFLGRANAESYMITCTSSKVTAEQGRAFPPWGSHPMAGPEWKQIALPPNAECKPRETDDPDQLAGWYLDVLIERASATLTAKNPLELTGPDAKTSPLDVASEQLGQALLLARSPDRRDQRKEVERLLGDIDYWHASVHLRDASATLLEAAKQFETAAAKRPRHVADAAAWAGFLRHLADELHAGPNAAVPAPTAPIATTPASTPSVVPVGTALPIDPESVGSDAPAPTPVPAGGVLL